MSISKIFNISTKFCLGESPNWNSENICINFQKTLIEQVPHESEYTEYVCARMYTNKTKEPHT